MSQSRRDVGAAPRKDKNKPKRFKPEIVTWGVKWARASKISFSHDDMYGMDEGEEDALEELELLREDEPEDESEPPHSDVGKLLEDSLRWSSERNPEELSTKLDPTKLGNDAWRIFKRYTERVNEPPNFELFCAQPEFEGIEQPDREGVLFNIYGDLHDVWRRACSQLSGDHKQGMPEPDIRRAAIASRVNKFYGHLFSELEDDDRREALAFSKTVQNLPSLTRFYERQNGRGVAPEKIESDLVSFKELGDEAMKAMQAVFDSMGERRQEKSKDGMDTGKWKSDTVKREREELRNLNDMEAEFLKVIHHKLPRQFVATLEKLMTLEQRDNLLDRLAISGRREMLSLGSNLLIGPKERGDETGLKDKIKGIAAFDGTPTEDGSLTPRSQALEAVYDELYPMLSDEREKPLDDAEFEKIASLLEEAEKLHYETSKGRVLDAPTGRWEKNSKGVFVKKKQKAQNRQVPSTPLVELKKRSAPAMLDAPEWIKRKDVPSNVPSLKALGYQAQRTLCSTVLGKLHAVRVKVAETGEEEVIDTEAVRRMRDVEMYDYLGGKPSEKVAKEEYDRQFNEWVTSVMVWVKGNTAWAESQIKALEETDS